MLGAPQAPPRLGSSQGPRPPAGNAPNSARSRGVDFSLAASGTILGNSARGWTAGSAISKGSAKRSVLSSGPKDVLELVVPISPLEGMSVTVSAEKRLLYAQSATEIKLKNEETPMKPPGAGLPGDTVVDLRRLQSLQLVSVVTHLGQLPIRDLQLGWCSQLTSFGENFFAQMPFVEEVSFRHCKKLVELHGLAAAQNLQVVDLARCESLATLGLKPDPSIFLNLQYVDMDHCNSLPDEQAWALVVNRLCGKAARATVPASATKGCVNRVRTEVSCPGKHILSRFDVAAGTDIYCSFCCDKAPAQSFVQACITCNVFVCSSCILRDKAVSLLVVWPSKARGDEVAAQRGKKKEDIRLAFKEGCRHKLRRALSDAKAHIGGSNDYTRTELEGDVADAQIRVDQEKIIDLHLLSGAAGAFAKFQPARTFRCGNGCGQDISAKDWVAHQDVCMVPCTNGCGQRVRQKDLQHHVDVEKELLKSAETWNVIRIKRALHVAKFHCMGCRLQGKILDDVEIKYWHLARKIKKLRETGVLNRGNVSLDYDNCNINMDKEIPFANRSQPDTSADFADGKSEMARQIINDLSIVINCFQMGMVLEGHTGATEPYEYWSELAANRAGLLSQIMVEDYGVAKLLAIPKGCPGGGAKVIVRPATPQDIFESFDLDNSGTISADELSEAKKSLGELLSLQQVNEIMVAADADCDGELDYTEFLQKYDMLTQAQKQGA
jgi:hypothetical protein